MRKILSSLVVAFACVSPALSQTKVNVDVNLNVRHKTGDVDSFDRPKFINFHATHTENYWNLNNKKSNDLRDDILVDLDVYLGRDTGGLKSCLMNAKEDPARPGFVDPAYLEAEGKKKRANYAKDTDSHKYEKYNNLILCNQFSPFYPDGAKTKNGWALSQVDTKEQPFGTASGEFYGRYIKESYGEGGTTGERKPKFVEIINEPLWDIYDMPNAPKSSIDKMIEFHSTVAKEVRKYNPDMKIGGYVTAFPDFELDNFERWEQRWKRFIDIAGEDMDFFSVHMYDFPTYGKTSKYRKGSYMEATMDMIEQYSMIRLGEVKPLVVSEYGAQTHNYNRKPWSEYRDWLRIKSTNSMMMQYMERADKIDLVMPFIMLKSEWYYTEANKLAHGCRMMRKENEPESYTGKYVPSELIKIYQLWKDVNGVRVDTQTDNQDIMCDAYVDGKTAYVIVNNLDFKDFKLDLDIAGMGKEPSSIEVRHVYLEGGVDGVPVLDIKKVKSLDNLVLAPEATYVIVLDYNKKVKTTEISDEVKYYATDYLKPIAANSKIDFQINGVKKGKYGEAVLRLGVGREFGKSLKPVVTVNGKKIEVPANYRGDEQKDRKIFFGVLEIPFSYDLLQENNKISITFPDAGGHVSTTTMQVYNFTKDIR